MSRHVLVVMMLLTVLSAVGSALAQQPAAQAQPVKPWPVSKLAFGRPVEIERYEASYACQVFPVTLEFAAEGVHLVTLTGRKSGKPSLNYRVSRDGGLTWEKPVGLAEASMAHACRDGDTMWVVAVCGDTARFTRYGTEVKLFRVDLKTGKVSPGQKLLPTEDDLEPRIFGMVSVTARDKQLIVAVIEDRRRRPRAGMPNMPFVLNVLTSDDAGTSWKQHGLDKVAVTQHSSVAGWAMLTRDGPGVLFGGDRLMQAAFDGEGRAKLEPLELPPAKIGGLAPLHLARDGKRFRLAYAEMMDGQTARFLLTSSPDGVNWDDPVALTGRMQFGLLSPFTHLSAIGKHIAFGYTDVTNNWAAGGTSSRMLVSRDGGKQFERIDIGARFRFGSMLPVSAFDTQTGRLAFVTVALVPTDRDEADANRGGFRGAFRGEAYLVYACSPPIPRQIDVIDAKLTRRIEKLVEELGHPEYERRERATQELHDLKEAVIPFLEKAARSGDLEVATRARMLLSHAYPPWLKPPSQNTPAPDAIHTH